MMLLLPLFAAQAMAIGVLYADYTKVGCRTLSTLWVGILQQCVKFTLG